MQPGRHSACLHGWVPMVAPLAVPVPPTNLTSSFSAILGFLLLLASEPLHKLCLLPATLPHPDTCYLVFTFQVRSTVLFRRSPPPRSLI